VFGLLTKLGNKMYQLTEAGREHARIPMNQREHPSSEKVGLSREIKLELKRLLHSKALEKHRSGRDLEITFYDACAFWGISPRSSAIALEGRFSNFNGILLAARNASQGNTMTFEHGGSSYTNIDLNDLNKLRTSLIHKFQDELEVIQKRAAERKTKGIG